MTSTQYYFYFVNSEKVCTFAPLLQKQQGSIAQLVQSACLTSRRSLVRTLLLPHFKPSFEGFLYYLRILFVYSQAE